MMIHQRIVYSFTPVEDKMSNKPKIAQSATAAVFTTTVNILYSPYKP